MGSGTKYSVGDTIKLTTDTDTRDGKVLAVEGVLVTIGWASGTRTVFSALVLERLTNEPDGDHQRRNPCATQRWRNPTGRGATS